MPCSTLPVLLEQHFGMKSVSTVHGLALSAWAFAGLSGNQLASFVVSHATDAAHRYSALIPIITVLYAVALASIIAVTLATKGKVQHADTADKPINALCGCSGHSLVSRPAPGNRLWFRSPANFFPLIYTMYMILSFPNPFPRIPPHRLPIHVR